MMTMKGCSSQGVGPSLKAVGDDDVDSSEMC